MDDRITFSLEPLPTVVQILAAVPQTLYNDQIYEINDIQKAVVSKDIHRLYTKGRKGMKERKVVLTSGGRNAGPKARDSSIRALEGLF